MSDLLSLEEEPTVTGAACCEINHVLGMVRGKERRISKWLSRVHCFDPKQRVASRILGLSWRGGRWGLHLREVLTAVNVLGL